MTVTSAFFPFMSFHRAQAAHRGGHGAQGEAEFGYGPIPPHPEQAGGHGLGDGLGPALADLAKDLPARRGRGEGKLHRLDEFPGGERRLLDSREHLPQGERPPSFGGGEDHPGFIHRQGREGVSRGGGVGDVPAESAAVLYLGGADDGAGLGEQGEMAQDEGMLAQPGVRDQGSDARARLGEGYLLPLGKPREVEHAPAVEQAGVPEHHQVGSARQGEGLGLPRVGPEGLPGAPGPEHAHGEAIAAHRASSPAGPVPARSRSWPRRPPSPRCAGTRCSGRDCPPTPLGSLHGRRGVPCAGAR